VTVTDETRQNAEMSDETIERIQAKIAYLESANSELSDVIYRQQQEIDGLRTQFVALMAQLDAANAQNEYTLEQEKPPHY